MGPNDRPTLNGAPELVIEARSPANRRVQEARKRAQYFANGTLVVWDVDVDNQVIHVYRAASPEQFTRFGMDDEIDCEPLPPNWRRRVADMFAEEVSAEAIAGEVADAWKEEGQETGIEIGREEGIEIGREEGAELSRLEIARTMLTEGMDLATIARLTNLSEERLQALTEG